MATIRKKHTRRPSPAKPAVRPLDYDDDTLRFGIGPYVAIADYTLAHGGDVSSCVLRQCATREAAIKVAAGASVWRKTHTRVELWPGGGHHCNGKPRSSILREFGGPSLALAAMEADEREMSGNRSRAGGRISDGDLTRRMRIIAAAILSRCDGYSAYGLSSHLGFNESAIRSPLQSGAELGYWHKDGTSWRILPAGVAFLNGGNGHA